MSKDNSESAKIEDKLVFKRRKSRSAFSRTWPSLVKRVKPLGNSQRMTLWPLGSKPLSPTEHLCFHILTGLKQSKRQTKIALGQKNQLRVRFYARHKTPSRESQGKEEDLPLLLLIWVTAPPFIWVAFSCSPPELPISVIVPSRPKVFPAVILCSIPILVLLTAGVEGPGSISRGTLTRDSLGMVGLLSPVLIPPPAVFCLHTFSSFLRLETFTLHLSWI